MLRLMIFYKLYVPGVLVPTSWPAASDSDLDDPGSSSASDATLFYNGYFGTGPASICI